MPAAAPAPPPASPPIDMGVESNKDALRQVLNIGLLGLGTGAAGRSALGLHELLFPHEYKHPTTNPRPAVVEVPVPEEEDEEEVLPGRVKVAGPAAVTPPVTPPAAPPPSSPSALDYVNMLKRTGNTGLDYLKGLNNADNLSKPWFMTAAVGAGGAGVYGGYKAVGSILDAKRKRDRERELEDAKRDYRNALVEQYDTKTAAEHGSLDKLAEDFVKEAGVLSSLPGAYALLATAIAGGTGYGAYKFVKGRSPDKRLAEAIKQRERLRWAARPPELYAIAKPVPPTGGATAMDEEDRIQDEDMQGGARRAPTLKAANELASLYKD